MKAFLIGLSTVDSNDEAQKIANALVGEGLAACVNIVSSVRSVYRWKGKICDDAECLLIIKTPAVNKERLKKRLTELHKYDTPELILLPVEDGLPKYLRWLEEETL